MPAKILDRALAAFNQVYARYKYRARKKKRLWVLSKEEFQSLISQNCAYCGCPPINTEAGCFTYNGIDRKNNFGGYTPSNVITCCWLCNATKSSNFTHDEMVEIGKVLSRLRARRLRTSQAR